MTTSTNTGLAEAQKRMVQIVTENDEPVIYSGNPAELSGARFEMDECMRRIGAFQLLIQHRACRMSNTVVATSDVSTVAFVVEAIRDDDIGNYTYEDPCPPTVTRIARVNARRALAGDAPFPGIANINAIPDKYLTSGLEPVELDDCSAAVPRTLAKTRQEGATR